MHYTADYLDGRALESIIEFEWADLGTSLEGTRITRGQFVTNADVLLVGTTREGRRRAYLIEWKYCEVAGKKDNGAGTRGEKRRECYRARYMQSPTLDARVPFEVALYDPTYQYLRMALLGDLMVERGRFGVDDVYIVSVCPRSNAAYLTPRRHPFLTHPAIGASSLHDGLPRLWRDASRIRFTEPAALVAAARAVGPTSLRPWLNYMAFRYGW